MRDVCRVSADIVDQLVVVRVEDGNQRSEFVMSEGDSLTVKYKVVVRDGMVLGRLSGRKCMLKTASPEDARNRQT